MSAPRQPRIPDSLDIVELEMALEDAFDGPLSEARREKLMGEVQNLLRQRSADGIPALLDDLRGVIERFQAGGDGPENDDLMGKPAPRPGPRPLGKSGATAPLESE